jgi:GAF domain-containing protein
MSAKKQNSIASTKSSKRSGTIIPSDLFEQQPTEERLRKLNRTYALLSAVNQAIVHVHKQQALFEAACRIAVEQGGFRMAWIGLLDLQTNQVKPTAHAGQADDSLEKLNITLDDNESGGGPTHIALRTGKHVVINDLANDPSMLPWRADVLRRGYRASSALPLIVAGEARGILNLYASETNFFDEEELSLLDGMAADIAFAMEYAEQEEKRSDAEAQVRIQAARLKIMADASQAFASAGQDVQAVLDQVVHQVAEVIGDNCHIRLLSDDQEWLNLAAIYDPNPEASEAVNLLISLEPMRADDPGTIPQVFCTGKSVLFPIVNRERLRTVVSPERWSVIEPFAPHSVLIVALRNQGSSIGVLALSRYRADQPAFTEDDVTLAQDLAGRAALAINSSRLFGQVQQELTERKRAEKKIVQMKRLYATLSQVNQSIVRVKLREELYQSICDVAVRFGEFSLVWIGLLDEATGEVKPVTANGLDLPHWPFPIVNIHEDPFTDGLIATAIRTSKVVTSEDLEVDKRRS